MNPIYHFCSTLVRTVFSLLYRTSWHGLENVPRKGPLLIASNHMSFFDPPLVGCSTRRDFHYLARESLMGNAFSAWLLPRINVIPVNRESGKDARAVRQVLKALKDELGTVIFPEGTRSPDGELQEAKAGVGLLACRSKAQVLPVRIFGSFEVFSRHQKIPKLRGKIHIVYGKCLHPEDYDPGPKTENRYKVAIERIMKTIAHLEVPEEKMV